MRTVSNGFLQLEASAIVLTDDRLNFAHGRDSACEIRVPV